MKPNQVATILAIKKLFLQVDYRAEFAQVCPFSHGSAARGRDERPTSKPFPELGKRLRFGSHSAALAWRWPSSTSTIQSKSPPAAKKPITPKIAPRLEPEIRLIT
jgi:hypothetical protein